MSTILYDNFIVKYIGILGVCIAVLTGFIVFLMVVCKRNKYVVVLLLIVLFILFYIIMDALYNRLNKKEFNARIENMIQSINKEKPIKILDFGSGNTTDLARYLTSTHHKDVQVYSVDILDEVPNNKFPYIKYSGNIQELYDTEVAKNGVDVVVLSFVAHHLTKEQQEELWIFCHKVSKYILLLEDLPDHFLAKKFFESHFEFFNQDYTQHVSHTISEWDIIVEKYARRIQTRYIEPNIFWGYTKHVCMLYEIYSSRAIE